MKVFVCLAATEYGAGISQSQLHEAGYRNNRISKSCYSQRHVAFVLRLYSQVPGNLLVSSSTQTGYKQKDLNGI
jgi:hypothetical protein